MTINWHNCCKIVSFICFLLSYFFFPFYLDPLLKQSILFSVSCLYRTWQLSTLGVIGWWRLEVQEIEYLTQASSTSGAASSWLCYLPVCSFTCRLGKPWLASSSRFQIWDFVWTACFLPLHYFGKLLNRCFPTFLCFTDLCRAALCASLFLPRQCLIVLFLIDNHVYNLWKNLTD